MNVNNERRISKITADRDSVIFPCLLSRKNLEVHDSKFDSNNMESSRHFIYLLYFIKHKYIFKQWYIIEFVVTATEIDTCV